jgi:hypothetical protein
MRDSTSFGRQDGETPEEWLTRLEAVSRAGLTLHQQMTLGFQKNLAQSRSEAPPRASAHKAEPLPRRTSPRGG